MSEELQPYQKAARAEKEVSLAFLMKNYARAIELYIESANFHE